MKNTMTKGEIRHELAKAKKELKDAWICGEGYEYDQNFIVCYKDGTVLETREANERLPQTGIIGIQFFGTDAHYTVGYEMYNGEKVLIEDESEDACYRIEYLLLTSTEATAETVESVEETTISETETVETEITEKLIMRLSDDDGNVLGVKVFVGTYKQADEEAERIMAETGCYVSYVRYTDSRWNWMSRKYYCGTDSESALTIVSPITMKIEQTAETAEQETELNTEVETEQTENNAENVSETYGGEDVKADTSKTDELSGTTKMIMVFSPVVSEYLRQIEYIDTS